MRTDASRGYMWLDGKFHNADLNRLFPPDCDAAAFRGIIERADGCFAVIIHRMGKVLAAVDRIRSIPIFHSMHSGQLRIGLDAFEIRNRTGYHGLSESALRDFLLTGYVCSPDTLVPGIRQLEAGQMLAWSEHDAKPRISDYYLYTHIRNEYHSDPLRQMDAMHDAIIARLITGAGGRTLVLPLSGGFDSRLIAWKLKQQGYENVICFTYGHKRRGEGDTSLRVARYIGYPHIMIHHDRQMWHEAFNSPARGEYYRFATNLSSSAHVQDWLAVRELKNRELIPADAIFVPGHSGGCPQGANLPAFAAHEGRVRDDALFHAIFHKHYNLWHWQGKIAEDDLRQAIRAQMPIPPSMDAEDAASLFDLWDWRQRQAKFIVNSLRVYEFFGYEWRIPLWDIEFMDFWRRIPAPLRHHRRLYREYVAAYQAIPVPTYHDEPWRRRIVNKVIRTLWGYAHDQRYGRFLDFRYPHRAVRTPISSLCLQSVQYPAFVIPHARILRCNINAIQALILIKENPEIWQNS